MTISYKETKKNKTLEKYLEKEEGDKENANKDTV